MVSLLCLSKNSLIQESDIRDLIIYNSSEEGIVRYDSVVSSPVQATSELSLLTR